MISFRAFADAAKEAGIAMDAVMVMQDERILGLQRFTDTIFHNVFSIAKSFTVTAIGFAVEDGLLTPDAKPADFFSDLMGPGTDPRWQKITLRHLMTMTTGHGRPFLMSAERKMLKEGNHEGITPEMEKEWLIYAFTRPFAYEPGQHFAYGNLAPYVAGRMLEKAAGMTMLDYLYEKLWKPMGVEKPVWGTDPEGHTFPASDLFLDITDMCKLGQLYAAGGIFGGRRYLSEDWIRNVTARHVDSNVINPTGSAHDEEKGYGWYFWHNSVPGTYRAYGREGQFLIVIPEKNAVIATQAMHSDVQQVLDLVWEYIYPQV